MRDAIDLEGAVQSAFLSRAEALSFLTSTVPGSQRPILVYGAGATGRALAQALQERGHFVAAFLDANARPGATLDGIEVSTPEAWRPAEVPKDCIIVFAIQNSKHISDLPRAADALHALGFRHVFDFLEIGRSLCVPVENLIQGFEAPSKRFAQYCICCNSQKLDRAPAILAPFVAKRIFGPELAALANDPSKTNGRLRHQVDGLPYVLCHSLQCQECATLFLDYRLTDRQIDAYYHDHSKQTHLDQRDSYEPGVSARLAQELDGRLGLIPDIESRLASFLSEAPSVLDWGGSTGSHTLFRGRGGYNHVYDVSSAAAAPGIERVTLEQLAGTRYDLLTCCQVLEHVPFPEKLLAQICEQLASTSLLYLEVPNEALMRAYPEGRGLARLARHWHEHINFFSDAGLRRLCERADLVVLDVFHVSNNGITGVLARLAG